MEKKYRGIIVVGLTALVIGWVLSVQISTTDGRDPGGLVSLAELQAYEDELKTVRAEKEDALTELMALEDRMNNIETEKAEEDVFLKTLVSDLEKYKMAAGTLDVHGPGLVITLKDPPAMDEFQENFSFILYNSGLLLEVVNRLNEAGAEAVSINEQRVVGTTEISLAGQVVRINGTATVPPYYIKAIGNPTDMENALSIRGGIVDTMKNKHNLNVEIQQKDDVVISRYTGVINFKNAKPVLPEGSE